MAGRPPKPTQQKILQGTWRNDRSNPSEPKPSQAPSKMTIPSGMNKWARECYKQHYDILRSTRVLTEADMYALELLAQAWGWHKQAEHDIYHDSTGAKRTRDEYRSSRNYNRKQMPEVMEMKEGWDTFSRLCVQFGLTPSSRSRVSAPEAEKTVNPLEQLLQEANA